MKYSHSGAGKRFQPRSAERTGNTPRGGRSTSSPLGLAGLAAQSPAGFASSMTTRRSYGAAQPQRGFAADMARGSAGSHRPSDGMSSTWAAVVRTGKLRLRDGH